MRSDAVRKVLYDYFQRLRAEAGLPPCDATWEYIESVVEQAPQFTPAQRETIRAMLPTPTAEQAKRLPKPVPGTTPSPRASDAHRARSGQERRDDVA